MWLRQCATAGPSWEQSSSCRPWTRMSSMCMPRRSGRPSTWSARPRSLDGMHPLVAPLPGSRNIPEGLVKGSRNLANLVEFWVKGFTQAPAFRKLYAIKMFQTSSAFWGSLNFRLNPSIVLPRIGPSRRNCLWRELKRLKGFWNGMESVS